MNLWSTKLEKIKLEGSPSRMRFVIKVSQANPLATELRRFMRYFEHLFMIIKLIVTWIIGIHRLAHGHLHLHLHVIIRLIISVVKLNWSPSLRL
jgi:hypothetical protein